MNVSFEQLKIFATAARQRSFSDTARALRKTQSAISTSIGDLEIDLGVTLFDRSHRYPVLTPAGEILLVEAESILSRYEGLAERANALSGDTEQRFAIGVEDVFPYADLASTLTALHKRFPTVQVEVSTPCSESLLLMVLGGKVALGLGSARGHYPAGVGFCRVGTAALVHVTRRGNPLTTMGSVTFSQLADHLQLLVSTQIEHLLTCEHETQRKKWHVQSQSALLELLKAGIGWAIVPRRLIGAELDTGELVEIKLQAYPFTEWVVGLDLFWHAEAQAGVVSTWVKSELSRTKVVG